uniref:EF-hand calcium binding domain 14 n=2 Tax=Myotis myotis TaxID=51298 RepID=A0A7J7ZU76_MYOMY|nr:EF-hand calcium binding domain 14 [Myotis myotis]
MKKRKELNALIGLSGESRRKKPKKGSGHRLLRTEPPASDSESSSEEEEEFGVVGNRSRFVKGDYLRCCKICYPLCAFVILAACVVACVGLVWMQVALKEDLDTLKEKFRTRYFSINWLPPVHTPTRVGAGPRRSLQLRRTVELTYLNKIICYSDFNTFLKNSEPIVLHFNKFSKTLVRKGVESNQKSSFQEIPKLNEELLSKQRELEKIESGELGLNKVWINITEMNKQISLLNSAVTHLKANVKSAADLISLPATVEGLQKSVASIGSTLNSVHLAVEAIQKTVDEHKKAMELLQSDLNQYSVKETSRRDQIIPSPSPPSELDNKPPNENVKQKEDSSDSQVSKLREKLQLISALSNKPESNRPPETTHEEQVQSFTSKPSAFPEFPQSPGDDIEKTAQLRSISLPGIASIKDLEDLFYKTGQNMDGKLTYQEIWNSLGSAMPAPESLREFDADGDGRYSFLELRAAVGV